MKASKINRKYGWRPDLPDHRDNVFAISAPIELPPSIDLSPFMPPVYDQGSLASCTANAIASAFDKRHFQEQSQFLFPSRLFIYYNEREMEGTIPYDAGARIRDGVKSVAKQGACSEALWDYNPSNFAYKPPPDCYEEALLHRTLMYASVPQTLTSLKTALASGHPIVFGFTVYESFESHLVRTTGSVELPKSSESALGGHAVVAVGYDDDSARFKCLNSWGADWGVNGFFTMPYSYLLDQNLSADFWVLKDVS